MCPWSNVAGFHPIPIPFHITFTHSFLLFTPWVPTTTIGAPPPMVLDWYPPPHHGSQPPPLAHHHQWCWTGTHHHTTLPNHHHWRTTTNDAGLVAFIHQHTPSIHTSLSVHSLKYSTTTGFWAPPPGKLGPLLFNIQY